MTSEHKYEDYMPQMESAISPKRSRKNETIRANNKRISAANKSLEAGKYTAPNLKRVPAGKAGDKIWRGKKAISKK
jgi:hypothetical protein